ncbi:MAG: hypothetical protein IKN32_00995 [Bacteroidales bacterium]|nr:hypothetical protein [Bacteroidales bacterium]
MRVEIYVCGRYYGTIRLRPCPPPFTTSEEEITQEIESRLPLLKGKKYTIAL